MKFRRVIFIAALVGLVYYYRADITAYWKDFQTRHPRLAAENGIQAIKDIGNKLTVTTSTIKKLERRVFAPEPIRITAPAAKSAVLSRDGVISLTNKERVAQGLWILKENSQLNEAALAKAKDMLARQYFAHVSPDGKGPAEVVVAAGYDYLAVGENLAEGDFESDAKLVEAWMASPGHRANILGTHFTQIGVAVARGVFDGHESWMAVQEFARPASDCPIPETGSKEKITTLEERLRSLKETIAAKRAAIEKASPQNKSDYRSAVAELNALIAEYNGIVDEEKVAVVEYNAAVNRYNACLAK